MQRLMLEALTVVSVKHTASIFRVQNGSSMFLSNAG